MSLNYNQNTNYNTSYNANTHKNVLQDANYQNEKHTSKVVVHESGMANVDDAYTAEQLVEKIISMPRNMAYVNAVKKGDEMTQRDRDIIKKTKENIESRQEIKVGREGIDKLICAITKCRIKGCRIHTLHSKFYHYGEKVDNGIDMFPLSTLSGRLLKGYELFMQHQNCLCIEVYERHLCIVEQSGKSTIVRER